MTVGGATFTDVGNTGGSPQWNTGQSSRFADNSMATGIAPNNPTGTLNENALAYSDMDGVYRPGDGWWNTSTDNTLPMQSGTAVSKPAYTFRPIVLNRPFESVAEIAHTYRDMPWRSLDFSNQRSADAGLLELFCVKEGEAALSVVAGKVDLSTPHLGVLSSILTGASGGTPSSSYSITSSYARLISNAMLGNTTTDGFFYKANRTPQSFAPVNLADHTWFLTQRATLEDPSTFGTALAPATASPLASLSAVTPTGAAPVGRIKVEREAITRALSQSGQRGTWNLLVDLTAQSGKFPTSATSQADFVVEGEKRYWLSVVIDRLTGEIVSQQLETVTR